MRPRRAWRQTGRRGLVPLLLAGACATSAATAGPATAGWQLRHVDETTGTAVYLRERADRLPEFRAVTTMHTRLSALVSVVMDTAGMPEWVYRTRHAQVLASDGPTRGVSLVVTAMPWPLWDREAIVAWQLTQDARTGTVTLAGHSSPGALPPPPDRVRMPSFESRWVFTPHRGGEVEVRFEGHADLGGNLALPPLRAFVAAAVWEAPLQTVNGLRQMVQRPAHQAAELPYIREPPP